MFPVFGRCGDKMDTFFFLFFVSPRYVFAYLILSLTLKAFFRKIALKEAGPLKERRCDFRLVKVGISWKFEIILFHEIVASGKIYSCIGRPYTLFLERY